MSAARFIFNAKIGIPAVAAAARYQRAKDLGFLPAVVEAQRRGDAICNRCARDASHRMGCERLASSV